ncbi:MAG: hydroxylamine oxidase [Desulfobacterales bacterium]|nr:hydroxylamine oxidase [Desulfobacterales bacterium]
MFKKGWVCIGVWFLFGAMAVAAEVPVSDATQECLDCHAVFHPGIVADWQASRHAQVTPAQAMAVKGLAKKISSTDVPEGLGATAVGCAECHTLRAETHADTFEHNGAEVHVVVSPDDCATCHATERTEFAGNIMAHARKNFIDNALYQDLQRNIIGRPEVKADRLEFKPADDATRADACIYCHGTIVSVTGTEVRDTDAGELEFPVLSGWPNQGVGRVNPDGSAGACSACHTRHAFSLEMARKPYTCKECHVGPDVPAFKVYSASKHGNLFSAMGKAWNFKAVPWTVGQDFTAPTCAACHISLLTNTDGEVIARRTHTMTDRLAWRIFGLIYAHPQPKNPDTTVIRNRDGQPLPTDFTGKAADAFLISEKEMAVRRKTMQAVCLGCHDRSWVRGHFDKYQHVIAETNDAVRVATDLMGRIWKDGLAQGHEAGQSPFDEAIERQWMDTWLFHANTIRFASAMAGGGDYGAFADGRYHLSRKIADLDDWHRFRKGLGRTGK